jgi:hypothetical protein
VLCYTDLAPRADRHASGETRIAEKRQPLVAEPIANHFAPIVLDERTEILRVDNLQPDALRLNDAAVEPASIDPLAHLVTANVQRLGQQRYGAPFPALADAETQPVPHGTNVLHASLNVMTTSFVILALVGIVSGFLACLESIKPRTCRSPPRRMRSSIEPHLP